MDLTFSIKHLLQRSLLCLTGKILGQHRGLWFHTIGQRKGLGLQLQSVVHDGPWFVAGKDADTNTVYVTNDLSVIDRPRIEFRVHKINWVSGRAPAGLRAPGGLTMDLKLRHGPTLSKGTVTLSESPNPSVTPGTQSEEQESQVLRVVLAVKDKGIAPGQFAAFYSGSECLGAGVIVDTAVDDILRQEEHVTIAKAKSVKNPNARSAMGA
jgi:tRNA-5-taurinomethyluridine 2-sulfurtransferase